MSYVDATIRRTTSSRYAGSLRYLGSAWAAACSLKEANPTAVGAAEAELPRDGTGVGAGAGAGADTGD